MERHSQPPPDDFPRLWGVEDKLGLYIPKQKGVLAPHGGKQIVCGLMRFLASAGCQRSYNEGRAIEVAGVVLQQKNRARAALF